MIDRLAGDHRCLAPDLRGFDRSPAPPGGWTVAGAADDVETLLDASGVGAFILVGHSMGGKIALALAARRLAGLKGLLLLAPSPPGPEPMEEEQRTLLLRSRGKRGEVKASLSKITRRTLEPGLFKRWVVDDIATSPAAWSWWLERGSREDLSGEIGRLAGPALVLVGAGDVVLPRDVMARLVMPALPDACLAVVLGAGHLLPLEAPDEVAGHLRAFAESVR